MPVSLAESKNNAQTDYDPAVIDEFRKESAILDSLTFDDSVNPSGGGGTLVYGYRRQITQSGAAFRAINSEYTPGEITTKPYTVELVPLGGSFEVDRVVAKVGPAASGAVQINLLEKIKSTRARFQDAVINGDVTGAEADAADGFDGLNVALANSSTEIGADAVVDWSALTGVNNNDASMSALDTLDEFLSVLDGTPTIIIGNRNALARVRSIARRAGMFTQNPVEGLVGAGGRPITRETYGGIIFADAGEKAASSNLIVPNETRNTKWAITASGTGSFKLRVGGQTTDAINVSAGAVDDPTAALEALSLVGDGGVNVTGSNKKLEFGRAVKVEVVEVDTATVSIATDSGVGGDNLTDLYAYRVATNGFHGVSMVGGQLVQTWLPDFNSAGAVKKGEVELGPVAVALKATKAAAVLRNIKVK